MKERSLVLFTILSQTAVGIFLVLGGLHTWLSWRVNMAVADLFTDRILLAAGPLVLLGMLASFFHLGSPLNAWRAVANLRTSWLSREILCAGLFAGIGALFAFLQVLKLGPFALRPPLAWLAALSGLGLVYCMGRVYMLRTVPPWNSRFTLFSFFMSMFLLGGLAVGLALAWELALLGHSPLAEQILRWAAVPLLPPLRWIGVAALLALGAQFTLLPLWNGHPAGSYTTSSPRLVRGLRYGLLFCSTLILSTLFLSPISMLSNGWMLLLAALAFAGVVISELIGRSLFYADYSRSGV